MVLKVSKTIAEFCIIFRSFFRQWSFKKKCFWDLLTFNWSINTDSKYEFKSKCSRIFVFSKLSLWNWDNVFFSFTVQISPKVSKKCQIIWVKMSKAYHSPTFSTSWKQLKPNYFKKQCFFIIIFFCNRHYSFELRRAPALSFVGYAIHLCMLLWLDELADKLY